MSTLDTAALWSATSLAFDEKKIGAAGLSVRQRKLLALLNQPASVAQLAQSIALPDSEVQSALERFAKLGLAQSDAPTPFNPMQVRANPASAAVAEKQTRMPVIIGVVVAALALVAASAWLLRGGSGKTLPEPAVVKAVAASPSTPTGPTDSADSKLPRTAVAPTVAPAVTPAPATAAAVPPVTAATKAATAPTATAAVTATPSQNTVAPTTPAPAAAQAPAAATVAPTVTATAPAAVVAPTVAATAPPIAPPAAVALVPPPVTPTTTIAAAPAAAARPVPAVTREIKLINRVEPGFPRGIDAERGTVRARLQVDARGNVTSVDIVESNPPRVFDRTVRSALQQWRYEPTGEAFTTAAEISFSR